MSNARTRMARYKAVRADRRGRARAAEAARQRQGPYWQRERKSNGYAYAGMVIMLGLLLIGVGLLTMGCKAQQGSPRHGAPRAAVSMAVCGDADGGGTDQAYPCYWPDVSGRILVYGDASECPDPLPAGWVCEAREAR